MKAHRREPGLVWQPEHQGRRGHPLLVPRLVVDGWLAQPPTSTPRQTLVAHENLRRTILVDDPATVENLDTPTDLALLPEAPGEI